MLTQNDLEQIKYVVRDIVQDTVKDLTKDFATKEDIKQVNRRIESIENDIEIFKLQLYSLNSKIIGSLSCNQERLQNLEKDILEDMKQNCEGLFLPPFETTEK